MSKLWLLPCAGGMAFLSVFKAFILRLQAVGARTCPLPNAPTCDVSFTARLLSLGAAFKSPRHWHCESLPAGAFHKARRPRSSVFQTPLGPCSPGRPLALAWCSSCQRHYPTTPQIGNQDPETYRCSRQSPILLHQFILVLALVPRLR